MITDEEQLKNQQVRIAAQKVIRAWQVMGPVPRYHKQEQHNLRHRWPTLARAIQDLVDAEG